MPAVPVPVFTLSDNVRVQGGAERLAVDVATRLDRRRFSPIFCATRWAPEWRDPLDEPGLAALREAGVPFVGLPRRGKVDLAAWRPFMAMLRGRGGLLHSHKFGSNVWAAIAGPLAGVPVVAHEHTWSFEGQHYRRWLDRHLVARGADVIVAVSRADRRRMIDIERIPPERIRYIPNGIDPPSEGDGRRVRRELGVDDDTPLVGAVGSLRAQKAFDVLIDAAVRLRERVPAVRVAIAGGGLPGEEDRLRAYAEQAGAADVVAFLGHRTDIPDVLRAFDVVVNCSDFEGQPLSVLEGMDAGLPVVATNVGGVPDLIEDGVHGRLVPPRDPAAIADAVAALLADPGAARELGRRARARRRENFSLHATVRRLEDLYEELLEARRATPRSAGPRASSSQSNLE